MLKLVLYNFRRWRGNIRIVSTFILAFILCFLLTDKLITFAVEHGTTLQIMEVFIWTFGDSNSILLASLLLLLLFADMPFVTTATPFLMIRSRRRTWVLGQLIYVFCATLIYLAFILLSTCVLCMKQSYIKNIWSQTSAILAYSGEGKNLELPAAVKVLEMSRPYQAMLYVFVLFVLYTLLMVFIMMFFCLWKGQIAGMVSALVFSAYGLLLNPENIQKLLNLPEAFYYKARVWIGWISPLNQATFGMHDFGYDRLPTLTETTGIFAALLFAFVILTMRVMRRYNFSFRGTQH